MNRLARIRNCATFRDLKDVVFVQIIPDKVNYYKLMKISVSPFFIFLQFL